MPIWRKMCTVGTVLLLAIVLILNYYGSPLIHYQMRQQIETLGFSSQDVAEAHVIYDRCNPHKYILQIVLCKNPDEIRSYYYDSEHELQELERIQR